MGFFDTLLGKDSAAASKKAAADTYAKQSRAAEESRAAGNQYQGSMEGLSHRYDPYIQGGNSAYERLLQGLGLSGNGEAFTNAYRSLPGYQSGMDSGSKAVASRLNAGPGMQSGAAQKALYRFGSDYEDQRSGDYLQRLMGVGQQGLGATQAGVNTAAQGYGGQLQGGLQGANQMFQGAGTIGQGDVAAATARSQGLSNTIGLGMQGVGMLMGMPGMGSSGSSFGKSNIGYGTGSQGWLGNTGFPGWVS